MIDVVVAPISNPVSDAVLTESEEVEEPSLRYDDFEAGVALSESLWTVVNEQASDMTRSLTNGELEWDFGGTDTDSSTLWFDGAQGEVALLGVAPSIELTLPTRIVVRGIGALNTSNVAEVAPDTNTYQFSAAQLRGDADLSAATYAQLAIGNRAHIAKQTREQKVNLSGTSTVTDSGDDAIPASGRVDMEIVVDSQGEYNFRYQDGGTAVIGFLNTADGTVDPYESGAITAGQQKQITCGEDVEIHLTVAGGGSVAANVVTGIF